MKENHAGVLKECCKNYLESMKDESKSQVEAAYKVMCQEQGRMNL